MSDPRASPSFTSFLADSCSSKNMHGRRPLWSQRGPTAMNLLLSHTQQLEHDIFYMGEKTWQMPDQVPRSGPGWTPGLGHHLPCLGLSTDPALPTMARPWRPVPRCWGHSSCCVCSHLPACPPSWSHWPLLCPDRSATSWVCSPSALKYTWDQESLRLARY